MHPGTAFHAVMDKQDVGVIYTSHFVERYHINSEDRPAVKKFASEQFIRSAITEGLEEITDIVTAGYGNISGIIRSRSKKINMSFGVHVKKGGYTLFMENAMWKLNYTPTSLKDYIIEVNPKVAVHFKVGLDADLKAAVLDHLISVIRELERNACYTLGDKDVQYTVDTEKNEVNIVSAGWTKDMLYVDVK